MQQATNRIRQLLSDYYEESELKSITRLLISKISTFDFTEILINKNTIFSPKQRADLEIYLEKLQTGMPIQYVLGETEFCGLNFKVDEAVLIPRPETEELVYWVKDEIPADGRVLDIGTGSACIAVAVKYILPNTQVYACDISEKALELAKLNAEANQVEISFFQMDILTESPAPEKYDVIISNPPYIPLSEKLHIQKHVKDFEPAQALFVADDDPLIFYRRIAKLAVSILSPGGKLFFEMHRDYAQACVDLLQTMPFQSVILKKDISGNDRMIMAVISA